LEPVPGLAEQPQGLGCIASRACRVPVKALCVRTSRQQPGGQVRLPEAAGQAKALFDERQSGAGLPFAQEDPGMLTQRVGGQVLIANGAGNGQCLLAVIPGDRVTIGLLEQKGRCGQRPAAQPGRIPSGRRVEERPQHPGAFGGVPAGQPELPQRGRQSQARPYVGLGQAERDRGPQIAQLAVEPVQPL